MDGQIRKLGVVLMVLFGALFVQVNYLQVVAAGRLNDHPANTRAVVRDFSRPRGFIQTADGVVVADSVEAPGELERLRVYPEGPLFAHVTGYFSFTYGSDGLERTYNDELVGRNRTVDLQGLRDLLVDQDRTGDLTLTLSATLQRVAAEALGERAGAVVALDPRTGAVLAMVDFPTYDPNSLSAHDQSLVRQAWESLNDDPARPLLPRTYRERYFPGSSFKVVTAAAALESGLATPTEPVYPSISELELPLTDQKLSNFAGSVCGGDLTESLRRSCNTTFAQVGLDLGPRNLVGTARDFGFSEVPPIDLPFGIESNIPDPEDFQGDDPALAKSAIGQQDVAATPLQMALVAAAVANDGTIMVPHLLSEVRDDDGALLARYEPSEWTRAISPRVAADLKAMMVGVVAGGTGTQAQIPGVTVAGKTGTAETGRNTSHVWFIGLAPAEAPEVAVAVVIQDVPNAQNPTGGALSAPVARAVMAAALELDR